jgi:hypothetical protein
MAARVVHPQLGAKSFSCLHCGASANHTWYRVYVDTYRGEDAPSLPAADVIGTIKNNGALDDETKDVWIRYAKKLLAKEIFTQRQNEPTYLILSVPTLFLSECFSCSAMAVWLTDKLLHPSQHSDIIPNEEYAS